MSTFPPKPGTVAFRALAHLEAMLPGRPRATAGMIAGELRGVTALQVREALEEAHVHGYVNREAEFSPGARGPVFYELVRGTNGELATGVPPAVDRLISGAGRPELEPRGVIAPVVDPNPPPADAPLLPAHAGHEPISKVVAIRPRADGFDAEIEQTPELADWLRGAKLGDASEPERAEVAERGPEPPVVTLAVDFAPGPDQFAVALASDGRLHCWRGSVPFVFSRAEARRLIDYLNRIDLDPLLEESP